MQNDMKNHKNPTKYVDARVKEYECERRMHNTKNSEQNNKKIDNNKAETRKSSDRTEQCWSIL